MTPACTSCGTALTDPRPVRCPNAKCGWPVHPDYVAAVRDRRSHATVVAGYTSHGKSSLLRALTGTLATAGPRFGGGYYFLGQNADTQRFISTVRQGLEAGQDTKSTTDPAVWRFSAHDLPPSGTRFLHLWDTPGENFSPDESLPEAMRGEMGAVTAVWLTVSAHDLSERDRNRSLVELLQHVDSRLREATNGPSPGRRFRLVVVFTKAEMWRWPDPVAEYLDTDPFAPHAGRGAGAGPDAFPRPVNMRNYLRAVIDQSDRLEDYTRSDQLPGGQAFAAMADRLGYAVRYAAVSDRLGAPLTTRSGNTGRRPVRVLDPLLLTFEHTAKVKVALFLDATDKPGPVYSEKIARKVWEELTARNAEVTTFHLGTARPVASPLQLPPAAAPVVARMRLVGPALEHHAAGHELAVVLSNGPVVDLGDFRRLWGSRLLLVRYDAADAASERWVFPHFPQPGEHPDVIARTLFDRNPV